MTYYTFSNKYVSNHQINSSK